MGVAGTRVRLTPARALAGLVVPVALAVASVVLGWAAAAPIGAVRAPGPAPVDALVGLGAALACAGVLALAAVGATVTLAVAATGQLAGRWADLAALLTPRVVRAAVSLVVGVTVVGGQGCLVSRSAHPAAFGETHTSSVAATAIASVDRPGRTLQLPPGWSPDRPAADPPDDQHRGQLTREVHSLTSQPTARGPADRPGSAGHGATRPDGASRLASVVVRRGDTLWDIAARHLAPGANDAQVAAAWPRWHAANRSTIGPDPNLILPGQRLHRPDRLSPTDQESTDREDSR
jgi:resuscitation-promoting factor RpfA